MYHQLSGVSKELIKTRYLPSKKLEFGSKAALALKCSARCCFFLDDMYYLGNAKSQRQLHKEDKLRQTYQLLCCYHISGWWCNNS